MFGRVLSPAQYLQTKRPKSFMGRARAPSKLPHRFSRTSIHILFFWGLICSKSVCVMQLDELVSKHNFNISASVL